MQRGRTSSLHGPIDAASQSTFAAPAIRHVPRSAPSVSSANRTGSFPESFTEYNTPGYCALITAAEFSTRSARTWVGTVVTSSRAATGVESGDAADVRDACAD